MLNNKKFPVKHTTLDETFSRLLMKTGDSISRRSFLHKTSKFLFGLAGFSMASQILPYMPPSSYAGDGPECGLHGVVCGGGCSGGTIGSSWVQCCNTTQPGHELKYQCCHYTDYCGPMPPNAPADCGTGDGTTSWCPENPNGGGKIPYICTTISCDNPPYKGLNAETNCESNCTKTCDDQP